MATPVYGVDSKGWAKLESTFNTAQTLVATDAIAFVDLSFEPSKAWTKSAEHTGSATLQTEIAGLEGGSWSATCYVKPSGTAGTAPDGGLSALLTAGMGSIDDASSYVEYNLTAAAPQTLQIAKYAGAGLYEQITGAWVESVEEDGLPMVSILVALAVTVLIIGIWLVRKSSEEDYSDD